MMLLTRLFAALPLLGFATTIDARQPNILVIIVDDQGYHDLGFQGAEDIPTPHIDSLAKHGVRCTNGYVSGPYCSPTRAGLMTGRYQQRFGHEFNPGPPSDASRQIGLSLKERTLADRMKAAGYATGMVGKWHLGHAPEFHPLSRGFEEYYGFLGGAHSYFDEQQDQNPVQRGREPTKDYDYLTDAFGREAVAFIDRHKQHPFFLYLAFNAVHTPLHASPKYLDRFAHITNERRRTYAAMTSALDDAIGSVLKKLEQDQLTGETLVVYVSDNGGPPANGSENTPLRGHKASTWEGGIRVPFVLQWTGVLPAGKTYDQPVIQLDILPTALAAAGVWETDPRVDGVNLLPYLKGEKPEPPHAALYWRFGEQRAIRMGAWKLTEARDSSGPKLFNLADDVSEMHDLSATHAEKRQELEAAWKVWNAGLSEPSWGGPQRAAGNKANNKKKKAKAATGP